MNKLILGLLIVILTVSKANSQDLLGLGYPYGTMPTNVNPNDVFSAYTSWKNTFTESCGDDRIRVRFDTPSQTVSEGIGYGMLIAAFANDQTLLDGLWNYYKYFSNSNGVMNWRIEGCATVVGQNGATDAELDAAMALIIADKRWGSTGGIDYKDDAIALINNIKNYEVETGTNVLKPGDAWGGSQTTNISYFAPAYYRAYKNITGDASWDNVASKSYEIIDANQSANNAVYNLVSDWCQANGTFSNEVSWATNEGKTYSYDAARTPWRIVLDYLWYGNSDALIYSNSCIDFINAKNGLDNIYPGYNLDGTPFITSYKDVTFTGAYAAAAMASTDQNFVNNAYTKVLQMETNAYFGATLRMLYLLTLSGNFYSDAQLSGALSSSDITAIFSANVFPNPVSNTLNISNLSSADSNAIKIYDLNGKTVFENKYHNLDSVSVDIAHLQTGIYFVAVNNKRSKFVKK